MNSTLVGLALVLRHGQRPQYPPDFSTSWADASDAGWTNHPGGFTEMTASNWNMTTAAFDNEDLDPHGQHLLRHVGEHVARRAIPLHGGDPCALPALLVADSTKRDVQSAEAFANGFYPAECANAKAAGIIVANATNGYELLASDNATELCSEGPTESEMELLIGSTEALTSLYRPQMQRVSEVLGCCSAALCAKFGRGGGNCTLDELPYTFNGVYWQGLYRGPLSATACFAQAWMLQMLSGIQPVAWGELSQAEIRELYAVHMRIMYA